MKSGPIEIQPADMNRKLAPGSRIRFDRTVVFNITVRAKDMGRVAPDDIGRLQDCWMEEKENQAEDDW